MMTNSKLNTNIKYTSNANEILILLCICGMKEKFRYSSSKLTATHNSELGIKSHCHTV